MRLVYIVTEDLEPEKFSRILSPSDARYELTRHYLFGGSAGISICSRRHITLNTQSGIGVSSYQEDTSMKLGTFDDINRGSLLAIDGRFGAWSSARHVFYIDADSKLQRYPGSHLPVWYPVARIIERYEDMVRRYGRRPNPTELPPRQNTTRRPPLQQAITTAAATVTATVKATRPLTKAERWQERKYLISRGQRSVYPDARIAAGRLAKNNVAVEKAKLAQNIYGNGRPIDALTSMPDVPEGWSDISNDDGAISKFGLSSKMLYDKQTEPDFFARIYRPDSRIFGKDMNPTIVFRGSRAPEFPDGMGSAAKRAIMDGDFSGVKNLSDWANNGAQGIGWMHSEYYKKAVEIGTAIKNSPAVNISGHSLGGGMASAASIASGKPAWTFNAAGLNPRTVEKYSGSHIGNADKIQAYRVDGELLTKIQEVNLWEDLKSVNFYPPAFVAKEQISLAAPDAVGIKHTLPGGSGSLLDKHGIDQTIKLIEEQKDDDVSTIRSRI